MREFTLERMFARLRPRASHLLSPASCESCSMSEILNMADEECLKLWNHLDLGYTNYRGLAKLRDVIATRYNTLGPDDILEVVPEEGIFIFMNTLLEEGDEVIAIQPTLPSLHEIPKALGCKVTPWPLEVTDWGWKLNMNFLSENISNKTKLIILNIPNNPTGYMPVKTDLFRIIEMADRVGAWIFCEETFRFMEHDPASVVPSIADIYPKGVVLGESISLAWRVCAWVGLPHRTEKSWRNVLHTKTTPLSAPVLRLKSLPSSLYATQNICRAGTTASSLRTWLLQVSSLTPNPIGSSG